MARLTLKVNGPARVVEVDEPDPPLLYLGVLSGEDRGSARPEGSVKR